MEGEEEQQPNILTNILEVLEIARRQARGIVDPPLRSIRDSALIGNVASSSREFIRETVTDSSLPINVKSVVKEYPLTSAVVGVTSVIGATTAVKGAVNTIVDTLKPAPNNYDHLYVWYNQ